MSLYLQHAQIICPILFSSLCKVWIATGTPRNSLEVRWPAGHKAESLRTRILPRYYSVVSLDPLNRHSFPFLSSWWGRALYSISMGSRVKSYSCIISSVLRLCVPKNKGHLHSIYASHNSCPLCTYRYLEFQWQNPIAHFTLSAISCWESHFTLLEFYLPCLSE